MPTFNVYVENAQVSSGMCIVNVFPILLMGKLLPDPIVEKTYCPSKIQELSDLKVRLTDNLRDLVLPSILRAPGSLLVIYLLGDGSGRSLSVNRVGTELTIYIPELTWAFSMYSLNVGTCPAAIRSASCRSD